MDCCVWVRLRSLQDVAVCSFYLPPVDSQHVRGRLETLFACMGRVQVKHSCVIMGDMNGRMANLPSHIGDEEVFARDATSLRSDKRGAEFVDLCNHHSLVVLNGLQVIGGDARCTRVGRSAAIDVHAVSAELLSQVESFRVDVKARESFAVGDHFILSDGLAVAAGPRAEAEARRTDCVSSYVGGGMWRGGCW